MVGNLPTMPRISAAKASNSLQSAPVRRENQRQRLSRRRRNRPGERDSRAHQWLSNFQSVDPTDAPWNAVSAFANCGRAVAHVRGSYVPTGNIREMKEAAN